MAVTSYTVLPSKEANWNRLWQRRYSKEYRVECDSRTDGPVTIRLSGFLPSVGNSYYVNATERDVGSFLEEVDYRLESASANPEHAVWIVTCRYGPYDANQFPQNPIDWPIKVSFGGQKYQRPAWADVSGNPIVNSAGDRFAEAPVADQTRSTFTVVRNELCSTFDLALAKAYSDVTNNAPWNRFATDTAKCGSITTSDPIYDSNNQVYYYAVSYPFEVEEDGWKSQPLDLGYQYLDGSTPPKRVRITDKNGQEVSEAQQLDGSGHVLASNGTPYFHAFRVYRSVDFGVFNLDLDTALGRS